MNLSNHTAGISRLIKDGHTCLGVSTFAGMTLTGSDHNNSLLWSRESGSSNGKHYTWTPWGNGKPTAALPGFNGERTDPVSGAYHLGNGYRAYNPVLRRFNCPDNMSPFGAGGVNPYAYCAGDPVNHTDPSGHFSWTGILGIVTGAIGLASAVFTAGASVAAAGGVMAAISSASAATLVSGGLGVAATATGIASTAAAKSNPEASSILGWVSFATGLASTAVAAGQGIAHKTAKLHKQKYFSLDGHIMGNVIDEHGNSMIQGYTNNFRNSGKEAIIAHGNSLNTDLYFGGFADEGGRIIEQSIYKTNPSKIVNEFKRLKINLTERKDDLYLISCYSNRGAAQELANFTNRPVIGFSNNSVYLKNEVVTTESIARWESPDLEVTVKPKTWSLNNLLGKNIKANPTRFYPKI